MCPHLASLSLDEMAAARPQDSSGVQFLQVYVQRDHAECRAMLRRAVRDLGYTAVFVTVDSATVGKRYSRNDELGIPYGVHHFAVCFL